RADGCRLRHPHDLVSHLVRFALERIAWGADARPAQRRPRHDRDVGEVDLKARGDTTTCADIMVGGRRAALEAYAPSIARLRGSRGRRGGRLLLVKRTHAEPLAAGLEMEAPG